MDLNMGCPVPKVVNNGEGSALMKKSPVGGKNYRKNGKSDSKAPDGKNSQGLR